jgi:hypothetical protein
VFYAANNSILKTAMFARLRNFVSGDNRGDFFSTNAEVLFSHEKIPA